MTGPDRLRRRRAPIQRPRSRLALVVTGLSVIALGALLLAGCGGDDGPEQVITPTPVEQPPPDEVAPPDPDPPSQDVRGEAAPAAEAAAAAAAAAAEAAQAAAATAEAAAAEAAEAAAAEAAAAEAAEAAAAEAAEAEAAEAAAVEGAAAAAAEAAAAAAVAAAEAAAAAAAAAEEARAAAAVAEEARAAAAAAAAAEEARAAAAAAAAAAEADADEEQDPPPDDPDPPGPVAAIVEVLTDDLAPGFDDIPFYADIPGLLRESPDGNLAALGLRAAEEGMARGQGFANNDTGELVFVVTIMLESADAARAAVDYIATREAIQVKELVEPIDTLFESDRTPDPILGASAIRYVLRYGVEDGGRRTRDVATELVIFAQDGSLVFLQRSVNVTGSDPASAQETDVDLLALGETLAQRIGDIVAAGTPASADDG